MQTITLNTVIKFVVMVMLLIIFGNAIAAPAANTGITQPSNGAMTGPNNSNNQMMAPPQWPNQNTNGIGQAAPLPAAMQGANNNQNNGQNNSQMQPPPPMANNPAAAQAQQSCALAVGKDSTGKPDPSQMRSCMSNKGFNPPPPPSISNAKWPGK